MFFFSLLVLSLVLVLLYSTRPWQFVYLPFLATMSDSIDNLNQVMAALQQLQLENEIVSGSLPELQSDTSRNLPPTESQAMSAPSPTTSSSHPYVFEPTVSQRTNSTTWGRICFINQIWLIIRSHPQRYASEFSRVGLVGTLLSGLVQAWFAPLVETSSPS